MRIVVNGSVGPFEMTYGDILKRCPENLRIFGPLCTLSAFRVTPREDIIYEWSLKAFAGGVGMNAFQDIDPFVGCLHGNGTEIGSQRFLIAYKLIFSGSQ